MPNTLGLFPGRVTYVIDEEGVVKRVFSSQLGVIKRVQEALRWAKHCRNAKKAEAKAPGPSLFIALLFA